MKNKKKIILITVGITVAVVLIILLVKAIAVALGIGILFFGTVSAKPEVYQDITKYNDYIGPNHLENYLFEDPKEIFPLEIPSTVTPEEYQFVYYNPWDAQYVTYLTLQYSDQEYEKELERLSTIGIEEYTSYYSVTGEPDGYDLVAMDSDKYSGFIYAMVPEKPNGTITYVGIQFCNYFLDLDIHDYLPDQYLLAGFDATSENPYRESIL